jgi:hypothetical protein
VVVTGRESRRDSVADAPNRLPLHDLFDKDGPAPVSSDRCRDVGFAIEEVADDLSAFDHNVLTFVAKQIVKAISIRDQLYRQGGVDAALQRGRIKGTPVEIVDARALAA